ncbi:sugar kinase [Mucisphaera calidilacus]|uniref:2-dehydro-3-deoxygluconokinase n=1 Tax=Mucisphaera calidilacus TaxID=2527982 RepID=A0A518C0A7_9BACT|nr:sugar kinase [Mucisphaera calidilacus]QDU72654.1 2-dehydro-3-deoxygluconokinase [Mucisphaera calidilacus]
MPASPVRVVTFGEIMLRLSTPGFSRFLQTDRFDAVYGGGEANVAASLAQFGLDAAFLSKLPSHEIGQAAVNHLRRFGVDTGLIVRGGDRVGIYFLETGASQRPSKVVYDRANAAVTTLEPAEIDPDAIFKNASWFHWTGITPALGEKPRATLAKLLEAAQRAGCTVSCDLNFRKKLWTTDQAQAVMRPLMEHVDVCIANEEDAEKSLGIKPDDTDVTAGHLDEAGYGRLAQTLKDQFSFSTVAITLRESHSASRNGWSALMLDDKDCSTPTRSRVYDIQLVDRVGGGDSFAAGLIYGLNTLATTREALEFAVAASCMKQTIPGDFNILSADEVLKLAGGDASGRVDR